MPVNNVSNYCCKSLPNLKVIFQNGKFQKILFGSPLVKFSRADVFTNFLSVDLSTIWFHRGDSFTREWFDRLRRSISDSKLVKDHLGRGATVQRLSAFPVKRENNSS